MKRRFLIGVLSFASYISYAQETPKSSTLTEDSLATGNFKDVLTSFFQLAFQNLTGPDKELRFASNPYAVMLKANPKLLIDTNYRKYSVLRRLNFAFGLRLDSSFRFNGFTSGINFALINKRDYTASRKYPLEVRERNIEFETLRKKVDSARSILPTTNPLRRQLRDQVDSLFNDPEFKYSSLSPDVKKVIDAVVKNYNLLKVEAAIGAGETPLAAAISESIQEVRDSYKNKLLWTIGVTDTTYTDQLMFSNLAFSTRILKGFTPSKSNHGVEFDVRGVYNIVDDTLKAGRDLSRSVLSVEGGLNYVWRSKRTDLAFFEFKMSAAYNRVFKAVYLGERKEIFTVNGTFRIRVFDDIWVPVEFRYDPDTGNVFGFLNVRANFTALKKALLKS